MGHPGVCIFRHMHAHNNNDIGVPLRDGVTGHEGRGFGIAARQWEQNVMEKTKSCEHKRKQSLHRVSFSPK